MNKTFVVRADLLADVKRAEREKNGWNEGWSGALQASVALTHHCCTFTQHQMCHVASMFPHGCTDDGWVFFFLAKPPPFLRAAAIPTPNPPQLGLKQQWQMGIPLLWFPCVSLSLYRFPENKSVYLDFIQTAGFQLRRSGLFEGYSTPQLYIVYG